MADADTAIRVALGFAWYALGQLDKAIGQFSTAARLAPEDYVPWYNRGECYLVRQQFDQAVSDLTRAIQLAGDENEDLADLYVLRGMAQYRRGDRDPALADLGEALKHNPNKYLARHYLGLLHADRGERRQAQIELAEAERIAGGPILCIVGRKLAGGPTGWRAEAAARLAEVAPAGPALDQKRAVLSLEWMKIGEYDRALAVAHQAVRQVPEAANVYFTRGTVWLEMGFLLPALYDFNAAIRLRPDLPPLYSRRGMVWHRLGEYRKAIADLDEAMRRDPASALSYELRANTWRALGEDAKADADAGQAEQIRRRKATSDSP